MNKICLLSAMVAASLALTACGGGGGGSQVSASPAPTGATNPESSSPPGGDSGSVSASFAKGSAAGFVLSGITGQIIGSLKDFVQATDGAVTVLNDNILSGQTAVKEINGDASFALGRWSQGTVTQTNGSIVLSGTSNAAYHYALFNNLATLPTAGTYNCDTGKFTAPTYVGGTDVAASSYSGSATGSASLSFSAAGAAVGVTINSSAGGQTGTVVGNATIIAPTQVAIVGSYFGSGAGMVLKVTDGGGGKVLIIAPYRSTLANGANYEGIAVFGCSQ